LTAHDKNRLAITRPFDPPEADSGRTDLAQ
jgi:hypothetical protein